MEKIIKLLSKPRLKSYLERTNGGNENEALRIYQTYIPLHGMLISTLGVVEVCLRNSIDLCLCETLGKEWIYNKLWKARNKNNRETGLDLAKKVVLNWEKSKQEAKEKGSLKDFLEKNKKPNYDDQITCITFGFWKTLFCKKKYFKKLWENNLSKIFRDGVRKDDVQGVIIYMVYIRNKLTHMEPVWVEEVSKIITTIYKLCDMLDENHFTSGKALRDFVQPQIERLKNESKRVKQAIKAINHP